MKRRRKFMHLLVSLLLLFVFVYCEKDGEISKVVRPKNITSDASNNPTKLYSKSYIQKFSTSWHVYAKANDIAKREKLKQALKDALTSIESHKKSEVASDVNDNAVSRIKNAAKLLKEFKQMYSLSENVKKTLSNYNEAKSNLSTIAKSEVGYQLLKRFLVTHALHATKRTHIPTTRNSFIDQLLEDTDDTILNQPLKSDVIQKRGFINRPNSMFNHYRPFQPTLGRTVNAFKKARIVLNYMRKKYESNPSKVKVISHLIDQLSKDMSKKSPILSVNGRKSDFPNLNLASEVVSRDDAIESLINDEESAKNQLSPTSRFAPHVIKGFDKFPQPADVRNANFTVPVTTSTKQSLHDKTHFHELENSSRDAPSFFHAHKPDVINNNNNITRSNINTNNIIKNDNNNKNITKETKLQKKSTNPFVIALLKKIAQKFNKRKDIFSINTNQKKDVTHTMATDNNTASNNKASNDNTIASEKTDETSKDVKSTPDNNKNISNSNDENNKVYSNNKDNNTAIQHATGNATSLLDTIQSNNTSDDSNSTAAGLDILQLANDENYEEDSKGGNATLKSTHLLLNNGTSNASRVDLAAGDAKVQDAILKRLNDLEQLKLSDKIKELEQIEKKTEFMKENVTKASVNSNVLNPNPQPAGEFSLLSKQHDTIRQLKEAKQAREKYEIAKHELAEKVKELYIMANDYEKQETSDQILEVKNFIANSKNNIYEDYVSNHNVKRDEDHPGIGLAGIQFHAAKRYTPSDDGSHKSFTMGMTDKEQHAVEVKPTTSAQKVYAIPPVQKVDGVHPAIKSDTIKEATLTKILKSPPKSETKSESKIQPKVQFLSGPKSQKSQSETLKVIAQAIQEDMEEIKSNELKKNILKASLTPGKQLVLPLVRLKQESNKAKATVKAEKLSESGKDNANNAKAQNKINDLMIFTNNIKTQVKIKDAKSLGANIKTQNKTSDLKSKHEKTQNSKRKGLGQDKIDEYLSKALAEFMGNDSNTSPASSSNVLSESFDKDVKKKKKQDEKNRKIVEDAMRQHAKNPNLPLPLVNTKGESIKLNKGEDTKVNNTYLAVNNTEKKPNDIFASVSDHHPSTKNTVELDAADKVLLDKATHMEEQIAVAQDKLYSADNSPITDPPPAQQPVEYTHPAIQSSKAEDTKPMETKMFAQNQNMKVESPFTQRIPSDPYGSIKDRPETPPHGISPNSPPAQPTAAEIPSQSTNEFIPPINPLQPVENTQSVARTTSPDRPSEEEEEERDEDEREYEDEEEDEPAISRHHHHSHHHDGGTYERDPNEEEYEGNESEEEGDDDDDEDDEEKKSRVRYRNELAKKRSLQQKRTLADNIKQTKNQPNVGEHLDNKTNDTGVPPPESNPQEELEDNKRTKIPAVV